MIKTERIKFIFPPAFDEAKFSMLPYGMCVLVGYLRSGGVEVDQEDLMIKLRRLNVAEGAFRHPFNLNLLRNPTRLAGYLFQGNKDRALECLSEKLLELGNFTGYGIICFSIHSILQFPFALIMAKRIKEIYAACIIMGGPFITLRGSEFMEKAEFVDFMIQGPGEKPLDILLNNIDNNGAGINLDSVPGLVYRAGGRIIKNRRLHTSVEDSPVPDFGGLNLDHYKYVVNGKPEVIFTYQFSSGCKGSCSFCTHHVISDTLEVKSASKIVSELKYICARYNARYFYICDSAVNSDYEKLKEICAAIKVSGLNIAWGGLARADNITDSLAGNLKESGCRFLRFGFESGSERILRAMGKAHTPSLALESVKNMHKHEVLSLGTLMAGFPGENTDDVCATEDFIKSISPYISELECGIFLLEPNSIMERHPEKFLMKDLMFKDEVFIDYSDMPRKTYEFNEIGGLPWPEKMKQQLSSQMAILKAIRRFVSGRQSGKFPVSALPFFLYNFLGERKYRNKILSSLYVLLDKDYYYTYSRHYARPQNK